MKKFRLLSRYGTFFAINFLFSSSSSHTTDRHAYISRAEQHEVLDNSDQQYVYLGEELSELYNVISRISDLENSNDSPLYELKEHIEDGFSIGLFPAVLEALDYAKRTLEQIAEELSPEDVQVIEQSLDTVINQVISDELTVSTTKISPSSLVIDIEDEELSKRCGFNQGCPPPRCCTPFNCKIVKVREPLDALDKARFKKDVEIDGRLKVYGKSLFKNKVKFKKDVTFDEDVLIKGDLTVDGTVTFNGPISGLTIIEVVIETLSATDIVVQNLSAVDAFIANLSVTDLAVANCINNLCINNLSVVNETVSNLSVVNETVGTLSVTNEIAQNLSVVNGIIDNLTVTNCMTSLCVNNLSVVDESVSGTLSVNNAVINNLSVTDVVIIGCIASACVIDLSVVDESVSGTLSVNNEVVQNLSATNVVITNLSVTGCLASLCVNSLSVVDEVITGTLSVTDEFAVDLSVTNATIDNLTVTNCIPELCVLDLSVTDIFAGSLSLCDLIVSCDIFMNNSTSPAIGNIMKNGNRFIHNFGTDNTFVGVNAGNFTTAGAENVGIGRNALFSNTTGFDDTAVGSFSMTTNTIGADNAAYGAYSLVNNVQGNDNVALGNYSLVTNTTGSGNTAIGFQAGYNLSLGNNNTFAGNNAGFGIASGFTNVMIGYNSGLSLTAGNDNIYLSNAGVASESGAIRIGTPAVQATAFIQGIFGTTVGGTGIGVFVDANGQLGTVVSSQRFKHDIEDMEDVSQNIYELRPVTFVYDNDETATTQYGLIAEQVEEVFPQLVVYDEEERPYTVRYHLLPVLLLNEIQKLNDTVQEQGIAINELRRDNANLNAAMESVMELLSDYLG